jgi:hypothetical protein
VLAAGFVIAWTSRGKSLSLKNNIKNLEHNTWRQRLQIAIGKTIHDCRSTDSVTMSPRDLPRGKQRGQAGVKGTSQLDPCSTDKDERM